MEQRWIRSSSSSAGQVWELVRQLQHWLVNGLEATAHKADPDSDGLSIERIRFEAVEWGRDKGTHGGGVRLQAPMSNKQTFFNAASSNISQVQYEDAPEKPLGSATALSSIVHPDHPLLPSLHLHISWTEYKARPGYWRIMADLNPSHPDDSDRKAFLASLQAASGGHFAAACAEGDMYFMIPALERHRGVAHFYLEEFSTGSFDNDKELAQRIGQAAIDAYVQILKRGLQDAALKPATSELRRTQLAYHTLYFFQVLTLDRGTTAGLLVHADNDVGILGSLPRRIDRDLLLSWASRLAHPQTELLTALNQALPAGPEPLIDDQTKRLLAEAVRTHYRKHPEALKHQATGSVVPRTIQNHTS